MAGAIVASGLLKPRAPGSGARSWCSCSRLGPRIAGGPGPLDRLTVPADASSELDGARAAAAPGPAEPGVQQPFAFGARRVAPDRLSGHACDWAWDSPSRKPNIYRERCRSE